MVLTIILQMFSLSLYYIQVWPLVCATLFITGPALWIVIAAPSLWQRKKRDQMGLLNNCCWFTVTLFLRQCKWVGWLIFGQLQKRWRFTVDCNYLYVFSRNFYLCVTDINDFLFIWQLIWSHIIKIWLVDYPL